MIVHRAREVFRNAMLAVVMIVGVLAGTVTQGVAAQAQAEITYFTFSAAPDQLETLDAMIAAFNKTYPNIKVSVETAPYADYFTELQTRVAGGSVPDVFELNYENFVTYANRDVLYDITELTMKDPAFAKGFYPNALDAFNLDGKQFGLPASFSNVVLFYNKDLFDAAGVEYPTAEWTWKEEMAAAEALTDRDAGVWGMHAPIAYNEFYKTAAQNGCQIVDDAGAVTIDQPGCVEALQYMVDATNTTKVQPTESDLAGVSDGDLFLQGQIAMLTTGIWMFPAFADAPFAWDIALEPGNTQKAHHFFSNAAVISKVTDQVDAAWAWQSFLTGSPETAQLRVEANWELPAVSDQAVFESWLGQTPPESRKVVFEALDTLITPPAFTDQAQVQDAIDGVIDQVIAGDMTPQEALTEAKVRIEALL